MIKSQLYTAKRNHSSKGLVMVTVGVWVVGEWQHLWSAPLLLRSVCTNYSTWLPTPAIAQTHYGETKYYPVPRHYVTSYRVTAYSDTVKGGPISYHELERVTPYNLLRKGDPYHNLGKGDPILELWKGGTHIFYSLKGVSKLLCKR